MKKSRPHFDINTPWFRLFREDPGVISCKEDGPLWILFYDCYMHDNHSLLKLLWEAAKEYKNDRHLVG